jgi:hypothetical protein
MTPDVIEVGNGSNSVKPASRYKFAIERGCTRPDWTLILTINLIFPCLSPSTPY